jgi:hypothetical protein
MMMRIIIKIVIIIIMFFFSQSPHYDSEIRQNWYSRVKDWPVLPTSPTPSVS